MAGFFHRHPVLHFVGGVIVLMGLFYAIYLPEWESDFVNKYFLNWNLRMHAWVTGWVLNLFGENTTVIGTVVSGRFTMQIVRGCDALEPAALFVSACLAFPIATWRAKLIGIVLGIIVMELTNVVRLVTLYYVGVYWPNQFRMMHEEVWQGAFIVLSVLYWGAWAIRTSRRFVEREHGSGR